MRCAICCNCRHLRTGRPPAAETEASWGVTMTPPCILQEPGRIPFTCCCPLLEAVRLGYRTRAPFQLLLQPLSHFPSYHPCLPPVYQWCSSPAMCIGNFTVHASGMSLLPLGQHFHQPESLLGLGSDCFQ